MNCKCLRCGNVRFNSITYRMPCSACRCTIAEIEKSNLFVDCKDYDEIPRYEIRNRENGDSLEYARTIEDAVKIIEEWERCDEKDGTYSPDSYEIFDSFLKEIVDPYE